MTLGPLLGFVMGPAGFCLGALVGFVCALVRLGPGSFLAVLGFSALGVAVVTLYASIPGPQHGYKGTIIDAQIQGCGSIGDHWDLAMAATERDVAAQERYQPRIRPDWRQLIEQKKKTGKGVVLSMLVIRERKLYARMEPWNRGVIEGLPWHAVDRTQIYFARFAGDSCQTYMKDLSRKMYFPRWEYAAFPPDNVPAFLDLDVLEDVPPACLNVGREGSARHACADQLRDLARRGSRGTGPGRSVGLSGK